MQIARDRLRNVCQRAVEWDRVSVTSFQSERYPDLVGSRLYLSTAMKPQMHSASALWLQSLSFTDRSVGTMQHRQRTVADMEGFGRYSRYGCQVSTISVVSWSDSRATPASNRSRAACRTSAAAPTAVVSTWRRCGMVRGHSHSVCNRYFPRRGRLGGWYASCTSCPTDAA